MPVKTKIGYKVTKSSMRSAFITRDGCVEYSIGHWTRPIKPHGSLCVFEDLESALEFLGSSISLRIFKCEYRPSKRWVYRKVKRGGNEWRLELCVVPVGTVFASSVKLLEEIIYADNS